MPGVCHLERALDEELQKSFGRNYVSQSFHRQVQRFLPGVCQLERALPYEFQRSFQGINFIPLPFHEVHKGNTETSIEILSF